MVYLLFMMMIVMIGKKKISRTVKGAEMNILSLSYGKDSLACIGACELLGWKIDRIVHAEVWATDTIPADLPPMVEFKAKADKIIKDRLGIEVEHLCAMRGGAESKLRIFLLPTI